MYFLRGKKIRKHYKRAVRQQVILHPTAITQLPPALSGAQQSWIACSTISVATQNISRQIAACQSSTNPATQDCRGRRESHRLLAVGPHVALLSTHDFHQAVQRAALAVQPGAVVLNLPTAAQDDFWAQGEVFHEHASVVQHLSLALAAHLPT